MIPTRTLLAAVCAAVAAAQGAAATRTPSPSPAASAGYVTTLAGVGTLSARIVRGVVLSPTGDIYVATDCAVWRQGSGAPFSLFAGGNTCGFSGDGGPATLALLNSPRLGAFDASGNAYIVDTSNLRVRVVSPGAGIISTLSGTGARASTGDGGPASLASLNDPSWSIQHAGMLYISQYDGRVRAINLSSLIITTHHDFSDTSVEISQVDQLAIEPDGAMLVTVCYANRVFRVSPVGVRSTVAGMGVAGFGGDGGAATAARLWCPRGVAVDAGGNIFIADNINFRLRRVSSASGTISTVAGSGAGDTGNPAINDGPALSVSFGYTEFLVVDGSGNLVFTDVERGLRVLHGAAVPLTPTATPSPSQSPFCEPADFRPLPRTDLVGTLLNSAPLLLPDAADCRVACCRALSCDGFAFAAGLTAYSLAPASALLAPAAPCFLFANVTQLVPSSLVSSEVTLVAINS